MSLRPALSLALLAGLALPSLAAPPYLPLPPLPVGGPAPLLYVRFTGPPGMRASFFQGRAPARPFPAPVAVGMRPGYCYRAQLDNFPGLPGVSLFPSLEVRGSLFTSPRLRAADFPVGVNFTQADIDSALSGNLVTKVYLLEHPDLAEPVPSEKGESLETNVMIDQDPVALARERGRLMLIVRLGGRVPTLPEVLAQAIPGTIFYPGDRVLMPASAPPCVAVSPWPFYDPILGPRYPEEECLHDGGDRGPRAAPGADGRLYGLDPEDTVAEFRYSSGRPGITCSNRVCLCVPRYVCLRHELPLAQYDAILALLDARGLKGQEQMQARVPSGQTRNVEPLYGTTGRMRPSVNVQQKGPGVLIGLKVLEAHFLNLGPAELIGTKEVLRLTQVQRTILLKQLELARELSAPQRPAGTEQVIGPAVVARYENGPEIVVGTMETRDLTVCCQEAPIVPEKPLVLIKCADRCSAQVGDVVTFTIKYSNHGGRALTDIAVSDSLSGRLEYVPGSAESDREAVLTIQENEAGSVILRWEVAGKLQPGQTGRLKFQARVR